MEKDQEFEVLGPRTSHFSGAMTRILDRRVENCNSNKGKTLNLIMPHKNKKVKKKVTETLFHRIFNEICKGLIY